MNTCPYCGRQSEDSVTKCPQCGTDLARSPAGPHAPDSDRTVLLKAFPTELEAQAAAQALLAAGVPYLIAADNCGGAFPALEIYRGIQVRVQLRDLESAKEVLADFEAEKPEVDDEMAERAATPETAISQGSPSPGWWVPDAKAVIWLIIGVCVGMMPLAFQARNRSRGADWEHYSGAREEDTDRDGKADRWWYYVDGQCQTAAEDNNYDGKPDEWFFYEGGTYRRYEKDVNFDGKADVWSDYAPGRIVKTRMDTDFDGRPDRWSYYRSGVAEREELDRNGDGKPDEWIFYEGGTYGRYEKDVNFDGKVDEWCDYRGGQLTTRKADTDFDGRPDVTYFYLAGLVSTADWADQDSGKLWKRASFRNGYIFEELIDTDRAGAFDTKITYDAFENPIRTVKVKEDVAGSGP